MYLIRSNVERQILEVTFSGRVSSRELMRAAMQAASLAQAGDLRGLLVDLRDMRRGPGRWMQVAAIVALHCAPGIRIALLAEGAQQPAARRIVRYSGVRNAFRGFARADLAAQWLVQARGSVRNVRLLPDEIAVVPLVEEPAA